MENVIINIVAISLILPGLISSKSKGMTILFAVCISVNALMLILSLTGRLVQ